MSARYTWEKNIWTGNSIARVTHNVRLVRSGPDWSYLYKVENWGDYSLAFPLCSRWHSTPKAALRELEASK